MTAFEKYDRDIAILNKHPEAKVIYREMDSNDRERIRLDKLRVKVKRKIERNPLDSVAYSAITSLDAELREVRLEGSRLTEKMISLIKKLGL